MQRIVSQIFQGLAWLFLAGLVVQFYLAGAALFGVGVSFQPHRTLGDVLTLLAILLPVTALVGRLGKRLIGLSGVLAVLTFVQIALPSLRGSIPWIAALHTVNALALMGTGMRVLRASRAENPQTADVSAPGKIHSPSGL